MASTEEEIKNIIFQRKGARKQQIARELNLGLDYIDFVCRDLERKGELIFSDGLYSLVSTAKRVVRRSKHNVRQTGFSLSDFPGMTKDLINTLKEVGYATIESLAEAPIAKLMQETKLQLDKAAALINYARKALGQIKDTEAEEKETASPNESGASPHY